jgi:hypothetical protein
LALFSPLFDPLSPHFGPVPARFLDPFLPTIILPRFRFFRPSFSPFLLVSARFSRPLFFAVLILPPPFSRRFWPSFFPSFSPFCRFLARFLDLFFRRPPSPPPPLFSPFFGPLFCPFAASSPVFSTLSPPLFFLSPSFPVFFLFFFFFSLLLLLFSGPSSLVFASVFLPRFLTAFSPPFCFTRDFRPFFSSFSGHCLYLRLFPSFPPLFLAVFL